METYKIPHAIFKIGGAASILAGILMMAGFILHPAGEDATFGTDPFWVPAHALLWIASCNTNATRSAGEGVSSATSRASIHCCLARMGWSVCSSGVDGWMARDRRLCNPDTWK
jgi:hypothetical protein